VHLSKGKIKLSTKNAIYSFEEYYSVFEKGFQQLQLKPGVFKNALILGFGLGSVPVLLERVYRLNLDYTGIELDKAVIDFAEKYLEPSILAMVNLVEADAYEWVLNETAEPRYDLIVIDLFVDHRTSPVFFEPLFLKKTSSLLNKNGLLLFNTLAFKSNKKKVLAYYEKVFISTFANAFKMKFSANWLLAGRF